MKEIENKEQQIDNPAIKETPESVKEAEDKKTQFGNSLDSFSSTGSTKRPESSLTDNAENQEDKIDTRKIPETKTTQDTPEEQREKIGAKLDKLSSAGSEKDDAYIKAMGNMADYLSEHNYGPGDYAEYSKDPEWQKLNTDLQKSLGMEVTSYVPETGAPDSRQERSEADTGKVRVVDAADIDMTYAQGMDDKNFWNHHGNTKEDYMQLAEKIPDVQQALDQGKTLDEIKQDPDLKDTAYAYFDPKNMVKVEQQEDGTYAYTDDGRHRIAAAQELGYKIPVEVTNAPESVSEVQKSEDISKWVGDINPKFDPYDYESPYCNNCGSCALAVEARLNGDPDAVASEINIGTIEEMNARTGMEQVSMSPDEIKDYLISQGPGSHAIVGVDREYGPGHWFNAYYDGEKVVAIDGQTGQITDWPPDYGNTTNWDISIHKEDHDE